MTVTADCVGAVSIILGGLLAVAPTTGGRWLGLAATDASRTRALGAADLGLGVAIMAGRSSRSRWAAVAARSVLHLLFASAYLKNGRVPGAAGMCALFVVDAAIAAGLRNR